MAILSLVSFDRWGDCPTCPNSSYPTGITSNLYTSSTAPLSHDCAFSFILSSPMILLLLQCLLHPPCPSFRSPSSSSSSTSFCAWAYFESGPILWYYILSTLFPSLPPLSSPSSLPTHFLLPYFSLHSLRPPFLLSSPSFLPSPLPCSLLPPCPLG